MSRRMRSSLSLRTRFSLVGSCNGAGAGGFCAPINSSRTRQVRHSAAIRCSAYQGELRGSRIGRHKDAAEGRRLAACDVVWGRVGVDLEIFTASVWLFSHSLARGKPPLRCPRHAHSTRLFGLYLPPPPLPRSVTVERTHLTHAPQNGYLFGAARPRQ